jgi:cation:H+ antiporter
MSTTLAVIDVMADEAGLFGHSVSFLAGLAGLLIAGNLVVRGSGAIGRHIGLSPLVIGLTIVAAGTSAPELAVVAQSVAIDDPSLAVGSIIGSNIANVLLVLGCAATLGAIHVTSRAVRIDIPIMVGASVLFLLFALDNRLGRLDGAVMFALLIGFVTWSIASARRAPTPSGIDTDGAGGSNSGDDRSDASDPGRSDSRLARSILELVGGIGVLALAARFTVTGAEGIAASLGVPELIVGLTIVAIGTSAPEIVTTIVAAYKGQRDMAVGNAVGSNLFNILGVLGLSSLVVSEGIPVAPDALELDLPIMVAVAIACLPMFARDHRLDRWEGWLFLAYYGAYLTFLVLDATGHRAKDPFALIMVAFVIPLTAITLAVVLYRRWHSSASIEPAAGTGLSGDEPKRDSATPARTLSSST